MLWFGGKELRLWCSCCKFMLFSFVLCERLHRFLENKEVGILDDPCFTQHYVLNKAWRVPSIHFFGLNRHVWSPGNLGELQWRPRPGAVSREVSGPTAAGRVLRVTSPGLEGLQAAL